MLLDNRNDYLGRMCVEAALHLLAYNENAVTSVSKSLFQLRRQARDSIHERLPPLGDIVVCRFCQTGVNEPEPEAIVAAVIERVHIGRACYESVKPSRKFELFDRALVKSLT
jgi:hypothetical protein